MLTKIIKNVVAIGILFFSFSNAHAELNGYIPDSTMIGIDCTYSTNQCDGTLTINDKIWEGATSTCNQLSDDGACLSETKKVVFSTSSDDVLNAMMTGTKSYNYSASGHYFTGYGNCVDKNPDTQYEIMVCDMYQMREESDSDGNTIWVSETALGALSDAVFRQPSTCTNGGVYVSGKGCTTTSGAQSNTGKPTNRTTSSIPNNCVVCSALSNLSKPSVPNPISIVDGTEVEFKEDLDSPMVFARNYSSARTSVGMLGIGWRYVFDKKLIFTTNTIPNNGGTFIASLDFNEENDDDVYFSRVASTDNFNVSFADQAGYKLTILMGNYVLTTPNGNQETYNNAGQLLSWKNRNGYTLNFVYLNNQLSTITDSYSHTLTLTYNNSLLSHIVSDNGDTMDYGYSGNTLIKALYNSQESLQYTYANNLLASIIDEKSNLYTVIQYDSQNRAVLSENALSSSSFIHVSNVNYATSGSPVTTQGNGSTTTYPTAAYNYNTNATSTSVTGTAKTNNSVTYDSNGNINSMMDASSNTTKMTYSSDNLLQTMTLPNGLVTTYTWDSNTRLLTSYTQPSANGTRTVNFVYDTYGNMLQEQVVTSSGTRSTNSTYSTYGKILSTKDASGNTTAYTYYADNDSDLTRRGQLHTVTNALNQTITINSYDIHQNPTSITNANGVTKTMTYDNRSRLLSETIGSATNNYQYDLVGNLTQASLANGYILNMVYDQAHRLIGMNDNIGNSVSYTLDDNDMPTNEQTMQNSNLVTVKNRVFDNLAQMTKMYHSNSAEAFSYTYNTNQLITKATDTNANSQNFAYDNLNRINSIIGMGLTQSMTYDNDGNTNLIKANSQSTTYTYDDFAELTQIISPDTGTTNLTYDIINRVKTATDSSGTVHTTNYDVVGRISSINHVNGNLSQNEIYTYDNTTNGIGYLGTIVDNSGSTTFTYDSLGNVSSKTQNIGSFSKAVNYGYDNANQLKTMTYPSGLVVTYSYSNGEINAVSLSGEMSGIVMNQVKYRPFDNTPSSWVWGNGTNLSNSYDTNEKLTSILDANAINQTFNMDGSGNINSVTDNLDTTKSYTTSYDNAYNLLRFTQNAVFDRYTYNTNNNRTFSAINIGGTVSYNYTYPTTSNLLTSYNDGTHYYTPTKDAKGNMITDGLGNNYTYDLKNNLSAYTNTTTTASYTFNGLNQRVSKTVGGVTTYFIYDESGDLISEYDSSGNIIIEHIYLNGLPIATIKNHTLYYVHTDQIGTPRVITDTSNNKVWSWANIKPFGDNLATENGLTGYNLRFSGQYFDKESNLHYNNMRTYNPSMGRYLQSDPIGLNGGANTFNYTGNNSLSNTDNSGLFITALAPLLVPPIVGGVIGGVVGAIATGTQWNGYSKLSWNGNKALMGFKNGAIEGALAGISITGTGKIIGLFLGERMGTQILANIIGQASANLGTQKLTSPCKNIDYNQIAFAGLFGLLTSPSFKPYTLNNQAVTSWADRGFTPDLNSGRWVMTGTATRRNFLFTGLRGETIDSENYLEGNIASSNLTYPNGWETVKGLVGQRVIK